MTASPTNNPDDLSDIVGNTPVLLPQITHDLEARVAELDSDPDYHAEYECMRFIQSMRLAMDDAGETPAAFARRLGTSRQYVAKLLDEDNPVNFTVQTMARMAQLLKRRVRVEVCDENHDVMIIPFQKTRTITAIDFGRGSYQHNEQFATTEAFQGHQ